MKYENGDELVVARLSASGATGFGFIPDRAAMSRIAADLGLSGLRKMRLEGHVAPVGSGDWHLTARLGATVVQPCVVTLDPVTTRIDTDIQRTYVKSFAAPSSAEAEMEPDESLEPLGEVIDLSALAAEALSLALPEYPRAQHAPPAPEQDDLEGAPAKPFAGLAALRDKLAGQDPE